MKRKSIVIGIVCVLVIACFCSFRLYAGSDKSLESGVNVHLYQPEGADIGWTMDVDEANIINDDKSIYRENK